MFKPGLLGSSVTRSLRSATRHPPSTRPYANSSVNPAEVSHFQALAAEWWNPNGSSRLLHLMNPLRHDFLNSCLRSQSEGPPSGQLKYLDVGCGGGIFAESAARLRQTQSVTAIDPTSEVIRIAEEHARQDPLLYGSGRLKYLNNSIEELEIPTTENAQYDVLALWEVIEHVKYPSEFLQLCLPFVKPGGWIVLSTIARTWTSWLTTKVVAEEIIGIVPRGTHSWDQYINEDELRAFFQKQQGWAGPGGVRSMGCMYVPALGWKFIAGSEAYGNYFFGVRKNPPTP
ncbi:MAG: hypothetical protein GOMPHAMPRED_003789 [Gomphillus americanus]|uniref:Ubiquinone biosynthesis O-methyltransferase, mitochondrial n=1 Tax=Gomphillus americanus TaxID=1940652 RepID=A0A8H3FI33_9LECA|nr:MAG: hypothetical protein GOMPHAMPRED_003789 [Gomphillus americanus]